VVGVVGAVEGVVCGVGVVGCIDPDGVLLDPEN
jgi:hypothetical protein